MTKTSTYIIKGHKIEQKDNGYMTIDGKITLFNSIKLKSIFGDVYGEDEKNLVKSIFPSAEFHVEFNGDDDGDCDVAHYSVTIQG